MSVEPTVEELSGALAIDRLALNVDVVRHAQLFNTVAQEYVKACDARDFAKKALAEVRAEQLFAIREQFVTDGKKATEAQVNAALDLDELVQEANRVYLTESLNANQWGALRESFIQRSYMLRAIVDLELAGYASEVTVHSGSTGNVEAQAGRDALKQARDKRTPASTRSRAKL